MIKNATFVSVWDDGFEVASGCKVNTDTNKVFDIEQVCFDGLDLEILDREYIIIDGNGMMCVSMMCILLLIVFPMTLQITSIGTIKIKFSE